MPEKIAVIGSGSWATALVKIFAESGNSVSWLVRTKKQADYILANGRNPRYLSQADLDLHFIHPTTQAKDAMSGADWVIFAVPAAYVQTTVQSLKPEWLQTAQVVVSIKGFVPGSGQIPSMYIHENLQLKNNCMVLSGPCHAEEIALHKYTYVTIAGDDEIKVSKLRNCLQLPYIKTIANTDPKGVEYVAILKNIIAIANGIADSLQYGDNFRAVLTSNAMREVQHIVNTIAPKERGYFDSVYFGDLLTTAYSDFSRNRTLGKLVGRGIQVRKALQIMEMVAEGYYASKELHPFIQPLGLHVPVINSVYRILHLHANPYHEIKLLAQQLQ
ncbi:MULTISPECIES: NAD(P)H-dependent glycerol-3-phosphate dehydrogenase [unclassified Hydrotalea]|uniref:NAD(P)H-dependent glycerol-3-phosphate dehydrogenase n=1 Tax=unclassified Hydrotalea TaxID=2643788 RepID=UPI0009451427|nr:MULTISPECIES: NAD(P)H-dependent glycerol-3-phosphate dehydrogenase [unclassified Hydrotalea]RWZ87631.1 MAG: glycerol-3-phosphate dehydrogenase [Hydrotalea sp. AMD]